MAKIKALRGTVASGMELEAGKVYDVSDVDARTLIRMGKAEEVQESRRRRRAATEEAEGDANVEHQNDGSADGEGADGG